MCRPAFDLNKSQLWSIKNVFLGALAVHFWGFQIKLICGSMYQIRRGAVYLLVSLHELPW